MKYCLGTAQLGMDYGIQGGHQPTSVETDEILTNAIRLGIDCFDSSSVYGNAEAVLGDYIKRHPDETERIHIISKLPAFVLQEKNHEEWKKVIIDSARRDCQLLNISKMEAYLFHDAASVFSEEKVSLLYEVQRQGLAKKVGVSIYTPEEAMKALTYGEISFIQIPYNVFDRRLDDCGFFDQAVKNRVEVFVRSSLLQGLIMMASDQLPPKMQFARTYLNRFHMICQEYDVSPLRAAIGYIVMHSGIAGIVFGVDNNAQLEEYLWVRNEGIPEELYFELQNAFAHVEEKLVNPTMW